MFVIKFYNTKEIYYCFRFIMPSYIEKPPLVTTSITAQSAQLSNAQLIPQCAKFELKAVECYEAYGLHGGIKKQLCQDYVDDLKECIFHEKSFSRLILMHNERKRQYKEGLRKKEDIFAPSPAQDTS